MHVHRAGLGRLPARVAAYALTQATQTGVTLLNHPVSRAVGLLRSVVVLFGRTVI